MPYTFDSADHFVAPSGDLVENTLNISSAAKDYCVALDHDVALRMLTLDIALRSDSLLWSPSRHSRVRETTPTVTLSTWLEPIPAR